MTPARKILATRLARRLARLLTTPGRLVRDRGGSMLIEFALVIPVFLALVIGIVEFGRVLMVRSSLQYAVEEAARYAMVRQTLNTSTLTTIIKNRFAASDPGNVTVAVSNETTQGVKYWKISATYNVSMFTTMFGAGPITLTGASRVPALN